MRECPALNHHHGFIVQQRQPISLVEAVSATIEMESYLQPKLSCVGQVEPEQRTKSVYAAIQHQERALTGALDKVIGSKEVGSKELGSPKGSCADGLCRNII